MLLLAVVFNAGRAKNRLIKYWDGNKDAILLRTDFNDAEKAYVNLGEFKTPENLVAGDINIGNMPMSWYQRDKLRVQFGGRRLNVPVEHKSAVFYTATVKVLRDMEDFGEEVSELERTP
jgi:hypothetical protein